MCDSSTTAFHAADPTFIEPMPPSKLSRASGNGHMDESSRLLRDHEWQRYIRHRRQANGAPLAGPDSRAPNDLTGIALSGGGIRSATFALGVLQALAHHDLLRRFDYLSTVSGGGYIGTSLTWLTSKLVTDAAATAQEPAATDGEPTAPRFPALGFGIAPSPAAGVAKSPIFPYGSDDPRTAPEPDGTAAEGAMLRYLRQHGNYLTPGKGITLTSVIVVLLRGVILNLVVWIPIIAAVMWALLMLSPDMIRDPASEGMRGAMMDFVASISPDRQLAGGAPVVEAARPADPDAEPAPKLLAFGFMLAAAALLFGVCVGAFVVYSLATWFGHKSDSHWRRWVSGTKYGWRRRFETWLRWPLWFIGGLLLLASVPFVVGELHGWLLGSSFSLVGLASGLLAFSKTMAKPTSGAGKGGSGALPGSWIASIGAAFLLYGVLLVSYAFGWWASEEFSFLGMPSWLVLGLSLVVALVTGVVVDLNLITIHRFYRDRLMEAYLPDPAQALADETAPAQQADAAPLSQMCDPERPVGPYHLINTNLVLTESDERSYRMRGGDGFVLSPLYCGSNSTGWQPTKDFVGNELTVPTAMAISGAAANPWTASGGAGVTRNPLVSMLMALMNLRLGFWLPNPNPKARGRLHRSCTKSYRANHFEPGLKEVLGLTLREDSPVCLLSDGGHFENLGLYELVRRRVRLILLCDGTADPDYAFADLQTAMARVWADFGARIEFDQDTTLKRFMPSIEAGYPRGAMLSECSYAIAQIIYASGPPGHLVYLTTALCEGLRLKLMGYKGANHDFPDQSTADQFFDEEQFDAYRELGYEIADGFIRHDTQNGLLLGQSIRGRFYREAAA